jgi:hypothetical protein
MLELGVAGFFVKASGIAMKHGLWRMSRTWVRVPGLRGLLDWTCGCVCHDQERILVSFGVDLLCGAAVGAGDSFPWSACVHLPVWFHALIWNCLL